MHLTMIHDKATIRNTANSESGPQAGARLKHSGCRWPCNRWTGIWTYCGLTTHGHLIIATRAPYERVTPPTAEGRECSIGENHVGQISWPMTPLESSPITVLSETTSQQTREMLSETSRSPSGSCTEEIEHRVESRRDLPKRSTTLPGKTHPRQLERKEGGVKIEPK